MAAQVFVLIDAYFLVGRLYIAGNLLADSEYDTL